VCIRFKVITRPSLLSKWTVLIFRASSPIVGTCLRIELQSMASYSVEFKNMQSFDVHESVHHDIITKATNKVQLYRLIYYS